MGDVIPISAAVSVAGSDGSAASAFSKPVYAPAQVSSASGLPSLDDASKLYPDRSSATEFNSIITLLSELHRHFTAARRFSDEGDDIEADSAVMNGAVLLPELFCLRENSTEGFSALITALFNVVQNRSGIPFEPAQLIEVAYAVKRLNAEPLISFESALPLIKSIRNSGLNIESNALQALSSVLSE